MISCNLVIQILTYNCSRALVQEGKEREIHQSQYPESSYVGNLFK
jgi:hypothetical protein